MTAIIGLLCSDGVVIGSDSAASFGYKNVMTIEQRPVKKIDFIRDAVIVAGTGQVGLGQRFCHVVNKAHDDKKFAKDIHNIEIGKMLSALGVNDFASTGAPKGQYGCVVAFGHGATFHLLELALNDFQPEFKTPQLPFVTIGSGQAITDPFLALMRKVFFPKGLPNVEDGKFITAWALLHAIDINPGGIGEPIQMAVLKREKDAFKPSLLDSAQLQELTNSVGETEKRLSDIKKELGGGVPEKIPDAPQKE